MGAYNLTVNGQVFSVEADGKMPLLWVLRDLLNLTGTKYSCGEGLCGACTVHLNGEAVRSCTVPVSQAEGKSVITIEGLGLDELHPLQVAWLDEMVTQCGYCQPGQIMTAAALLAAKPHPTDDEIDVALAGSLCRCGTYLRIRAAIHHAAQEA